jgi:preprotein translocase subunit YajC
LNKETNLRKTKILSLGIVAALLALMVSASSCAVATTSTDANGNVVTPNPWTSMLPLLIFTVVIFGLMYFFTIRPQRKKQQETMKMLQALQKGDKIITNAGIYGQIDTVYDDSFLIKTDSGSTMKVAKWAVVGKQPEDTAHS